LKNTLAYHSKEGNTSKKVSFHLFLFLENMEERKNVVFITKKLFFKQHSNKTGFSQAFKAEGQRDGSIVTALKF
jgi:hypothetical protein